MRSKFGVGLHDRTVRLALVVAVAVLVSAAAAATARGAVNPFFYGQLSSGSYTTWVDSCDGVTATEATWTTGAGAYGKAVVISASGSWLAATETTSGDAFAYASGGIKSYCSNTTPWQITLYYHCSAYYDPGGSCA
jgi:hypothetical protein